MIPPPPWRSRVSALLWFHRTARGARDGLPPALRGRRGLPVTVGGWVRYLDGPVGPYEELLCSPVAFLNGDGHVAFMAVDSEDSVRGGRENWALPKELARFGPTAGGWYEGRGDGWAVRVRATARASSFPHAGRGACVQVRPDGSLQTFGFSMSGTARLARAEVELEGRPAGLRPGRFWAVALAGDQVVEAPRSPTPS